VHEVTYDDRVEQLVKQMRDERRAYRLDRSFGFKAAEFLGGKELPPAPYVIAKARAGP
jgi:hypothetical protein